MNVWMCTYWNEQSVNVVMVLGPCLESHWDGGFDAIEPLTTTAIQTIT